MSRHFNQGSPGTLRVDIGLYTSCHERFGYIQDTVDIEESWAMVRMDVGLCHGSSSSA